jgi:type III pantothenate kinase
MKYLFFVIVVANVWLYGVGAGWLGTPPAEKGRAVGRVGMELNGDKIAIGR